MSSSFSREVAAQTQSLSAQFREQSLIANSLSSCSDQERLLVKLGFAHCQLPGLQFVMTKKDQFFAEAEEKRDGEREDNKDKVRSLIGILCSFFILSKF